jgi:hypothetical protein
VRTYLLSTLFFKSPGEHPHLNYIDGASWQAKCRLHWVHYAVREKKQGEARVHEFYIEDNVEHQASAIILSATVHLWHHNLVSSLQAAQKRAMDGGTPLKIRLFFCFQICQHTGRV